MNQQMQPPVPGTVPRPRKSLPVWALVLIIIAAASIPMLVLIALLTVSSFQGSQSKARDQHRTTDINTMHSSLEEYFRVNGGYPASVSTDIFPGLDAAALKDPVGGNEIVNYPAVPSLTAAQEIQAPQSDDMSSSSYLYIPFPTDCTTNCKGYILKSYIESPNSTVNNPYTKRSIN